MLKIDLCVRKRFCTIHTRRPRGMAVFVAPTSWKAPNPAVLTERMQKAIFPDVPYFCEFLGPPAQRVIPYHRIGSPSSDAEVYQITYAATGVRAALKLMPLRSEADIGKNETEIAFARRVSQVVKDGMSEHFPIVYVAGRCDNVKFFDGSVFQEDAYNYARLNALKKEYPSKESLITRLAKAKLTSKDIIQRLGLDVAVCKDAAPSAHFMISELANEDLMMSEHSIVEWKEICSGVTEAIIDLHEYTNICHNDLHLGNILLLHSSGGKIPLIHDFGRSVELSMDNWIDDYIKFFYALEKVEVVKDVAEGVSGIVAKFDITGSERELYEILVDALK